MHLLREPFRWPCGSGSTVPSASPSTAGLGLPYMPLHAAIGRVFVPYRPSGRHGRRFLCRKSSFGGLWPLTFLFYHVLWNGRGAAINTQAQPGHRESPESSSQRENVCGTIPRPRRSRSGETGWGSTNAYIEGAIYL